MNRGYDILGDDIVVCATFGPGTYFLGDICYALPENIYDKIWGDKYKFKPGVYLDYGFAVDSTAYGDGCYYGSDGNDYPVDAGVIGVVDITKERRDHMSDLNECGRIIEVNDHLRFVSTANGYFEFNFDGHSFSIDTDPYSDEVDDDIVYTGGYRG